MQEILTITRRLYEGNVLKVKLKDLDKSKLSNRFLRHGFDDEYELYIACDADGNILYRGKKGEYRTYDINYTDKFKDA